MLGLDDLVTPKSMSDFDRFINWHTLKETVSLGTHSTLTLSPRVWRAE